MAYGTGDMGAMGTRSLIASYPGSKSSPAYPGQNEFDDTPYNSEKQGTQPSKLDKSAALRVLKAWWKADASHSSVWRVEAKEDFDFRAGDQWSAEDRQLLNAQQRPHIVFNRMLTMLKAVAGMEINGRHEIHFIPRHNEDTAINELLSGASKWLGDQCDAEDEQSQAFDNCQTCGMGWTETRLEYEDDPQGKAIEESIDPIEMYWDRTAKKRNLTDSRRIHRVRKIPFADAQQMFPGFNRMQIDAIWAIGTEVEVATKTLEEKRKREENTTDTTYDDMLEVTIVNTQWFEREVYYKVADPTTNQTFDLSEEQFQIFHSRAQMIGMEVVAAKMTRKVYKEAFVGAEILSIGDAAIKGQFKWACITGELNRSRGTWFGLVRVMRDPQMWANKWLSQSLHILNTTAKGGIIAEEDAFDDIRDVEENWARPDSIVWAKRGALSGNKPKIMPRPGQGFVQGHMEMLTFAINALREVTGINLELLGQKEINQPGILEAMRKQAGMTVLATLFDSLRRYRKIVGRLRLFIIQNFLSDGRLIRIVGADGAQAVPLLKSAVVGEYDVVVDDTPTSPNQKEANWIIIAQLLPMFKEQLAQNPDLLIEILQYSPLPAKLIESVKQLTQKMAPQQQQMRQLSIADATAKINLNQAKAEQALAAAGKEQQTALYDIAIAAHELSKAHAEAEIARQQHELEMAKAPAEIDLSRAKALNERMKAAHEGVKTSHTRVLAGIDALTPIEHRTDSENQQALGAQQLELAKQTMRTDAAADRAGGGAGPMGMGGRGAGPQAAPGGAGMQQ